MKQIRSPLPTSTTATGEPLGLLTVLEVAQLLRVPRKAVYHLVAMRRIPHVKMGRSLRFIRTDVVAWLERNRVPSLER